MVPARALLGNAGTAGSGPPPGRKAFQVTRERPPNGTHLTRRRGGGAGRQAGGLGGAEGHSSPGDAEKR